MLKSALPFLGRQTRLENATLPFAKVPAHRSRLPLDKVPAGGRAMNFS